MKEIPRHKGSSLKILFRIQREGILPFQNELVAKYGDICLCKGFGITLIFVSKREYIKHILYDNRTNYEKIKRLNAFQQVFGKFGLIFTNDQEHWKKDKRIVMPVFQQSRLEEYAQVFIDNCTELLHRWDDLHSQNTLDIKIGEEMSRLSLKNLLQTEFGNTPLDTAYFFNLLRTVLSGVNALVKSVFGLNYRLPTATGLRYKKAVDELQQLISNIAITKIKSGNFGNDLLSVLISAYLSESDQETALIKIRDELLTFLVAGYETTAAALEWSWVILSQQPYILRSLRAELKQVVGDRTPTYADFEKLPSLRNFLLEVLRLHQPAVNLLRTSVSDDNIDGFQIPANATVIVPISAVHRRSIYWENPEGFDPDRYTRIDLNSEDFLYTYLAFGGGPRICIGKNFAIVQACLTIAMIIQKFDLTLPENVKIALERSVIRHPRGDLTMTLKKIT